MTNNSSAIGLFDSQVIIDALPVGLLWVNEEGKIVFFNKKLVEDINWNTENLKNLPLKSICPTYSRETWSEEWKSFKQTKVSIRKLELMTELGFFFPVQIIFSLIKQDGVDLLFGIVQNLLDQEQDKLLIDSDNDYQRIGRWELDVLKERAIFTTICYDILRIEQEDPVLDFGDHESFFEQALPKEQLYQLQAMLNTSFDKKLPTELELCVVQANQKNLWLNFRISPIVADGIVVKIVGTIQDISEFKKKDEELKEAIEKI